MTTAEFTAHPAQVRRPLLGPAAATGIAAIALAVAFNVPFSVLASIFDYPDVLRRPAGEALDMFAAGGPVLIVVWYSFMLTALALAVLAPRPSASRAGCSPFRPWLRPTPTPRRPRRPRAPSSF